MSSADNEAGGRPPIIVNQADVPETTRTIGDHWGASYKTLTPSMRARGGALGINMMRLPSGHTTCPFHHHRREDEAFYVLSGRGVLRYGDALHPIGPGDCVACPAGTGVAHQIANPHDEDLVYLAIGSHDPDEVCVYPDSGKVMVRSLQTVGRLEATAYLDGEGERPKVFALL
ncbi:MAG: cupin domain-containing protein, partial [Myxococcales bacterium]|nr:cupin domain-containing protein [Myxococcales bacterium]